MKEDIKLILADNNFFDNFFKIKSEEKNIYWSGHNESPSYPFLKCWYNKQLKKSDRLIFKIVYQKLDVGYLYLDILKNSEIELSYAVSEAYEGLGIANNIVKIVIKYINRNYLGFKVKAYVASTNIASQRVIGKNLFFRTGQSYTQILKKDNKEVIMEEFILKEKVFIIAEAGVNHNGDITLAKKLIDVAVEAGVDAVKFQTWKTELLVTQNAQQAEYQTNNTGREESQYDMLKRLELSYSDFRELKEYCDAKNILFLSTPDEPTSADFLKELQSVFKIGSGELTNIPFLKHIGAFKKKIILSTGMGTLGEVEKALNTLIKSGTPKEMITLLHATTMYPTPMKEVNLKAMLTLKDAFKVAVGYSDHTMGIEVPIASVAMGATVIEKHFTLSCDMEGPDHKASLEPEELKLMVKGIRNIEEALSGTGEKIPQKSEIKNKKVVRKSIIAKQIIKKGEVFTSENLDTKRVGEGISSVLWDEVLGLKANNTFDIDEAIKL